MAGGEDTGHLRGCRVKTGIARRVWGAPGPWYLVRPDLETMVGVRQDAPDSIAQDRVYGGTATKSLACPRWPC